MTQRSNDHALGDPESEELQRWARQVFDALPLRTAPTDLAARVMRELEQRAHRPWYQRPFAHWPPVARCAFVSICLTLVVLLTVGTRLGIAWPSATAGDLHPLFAGAAMAHVMSQSVAAAIPAGWLYAGFAFGAGLYVSLFGLAATAYRLLYLAPSHPR